MILSHSPVKAFDTERLSIVKILLKAKKTFSSWQNVERWRFAFCVSTVLTFIFSPAGVTHSGKWQRSSSCHWAFLRRNLQWNQKEFSFARLWSNEEEFSFGEKKKRVFLVKKAWKLASSTHIFVFSTINRVNIFFEFFCQRFDIHYC